MVCSTGSAFSRAAATDHDSQGGVASANIPTADRRIQGIHAYDGQGRGDLAGGSGLDGRVIDHDQAGVGAGNNPILAQCHLFHIRRIRQVGEDYVHLGGDLRRGEGGDGAFGHQFVDSCPAAVVDHQREAGFMNIAGDAFAHQPQTNVTNFQHFSTSLK
jgi:hypothetical protein